MNLKHLSAEQRQLLTERLEDLKEFKSLHDQLMGWLAHKDKMVSVLGPVATQPAMVKHQLQQVQVGYYARKHCTKQDAL